MAGGRPVVQNQGHKTESLAHIYMSKDSVVNDFTIPGNYNNYYEIVKIMHMGDIVTIN